MQGRAAGWTGSARGHPHPPPHRGPWGGLAQSPGLAPCGLLPQCHGEVRRPPAASGDEGAREHTQQRVRDPEGHLHSLPGRGRAASCRRARHWGEAPPQVGTDLAHPCLVWVGVEAPGVCLVTPCSVPKGGRPWLYGLCWPEEPTVLKTCPRPGLWGPASMSPARPTGPSAGLCNVHPSQWPGTGLPSSAVVGKGVGGECYYRPEVVAWAGQRASP